MSTEVTHGGFWLRFWATIIDSTWLSVIVVGFLWSLLGPDSVDVTLEGSGGPLYVVIHWVFPFVVVMAFWIIKAATPGKMLFGMKIVDAESREPVSAQRLVLRYLSYFISALPLFLGFLWVAWDEKKQAWHDKLAGTVVVRGL